MATLPLYTPDPVHPDGSHTVFAPGGYERWRFDAESADGSVRFIASFSLGWFDHPDYAQYRRRYDRYLRRPTRRPPPVPAEYPCVSWGVYAHGRRLERVVQPCEPNHFRSSADRLELSAGSSGALADDDGTIRLRLEDPPGSARSELVFRPIFQRKPVQVHQSPYHQWIIADALYEVEGILRVHSSSGATSFSGRGFHDHVFGAAPVGGPGERWICGRVLEEGRLTAVGAGTLRPREEGAAGWCFEAEASGSRLKPADATLPALASPAIATFTPSGLELSNPSALERYGSGVQMLECDAWLPRAGGLVRRTALCECGGY